MTQFILVISVLTCLFSAAFVNYRIARQRYYWERILEAIKKEADKSIESAERIEKTIDENRAIALMLIEKTADSRMLFSTSLTELRGLLEKAHNVETNINKVVKEISGKL
jgi:predicted RNase H-related nuclease YkuK (DUF458 family)